jgi:hypothetical protein
MADKDFVVKNGIVVNTSFIANSTSIRLGLTSTNVAINTTSISIGGNLIANSTGANNAFNLGGTAAASYQLNSTLSGNVAKLTANNASNFAGELPAYYTNATNITSGTLNTARLPATATVTTLNTTTLNVSGAASITTTTDMSGKLTLSTAINGETARFTSSSGSGIVSSYGLNGYGAFSMSSSGTNSGYIFFNDSGGAREIGRITSTSSSMAIDVLGTQRAYFNSSGLTVNQAIVAGGNITAFSDERLKTEIKTIEDALNKVKQMRGVNFIKDEKYNTGVIAQEIQKIMPEVVDDSHEYLSVAYGNLVGVLIEAIKELADKVDRLEKK